MVCSFWEGAMDEVAVDGVSIGLTGRTAILDTVSRTPLCLVSLLPDSQQIRTIRVQLFSSLRLPTPKLFTLLFPARNLTVKEVNHSSFYLIRDSTDIFHLPRMPRLHSTLYDERDVILDFRRNCFQHSTFGSNLLTSHRRSHG